VDGAELREIGAGVESLRELAVDARHAAILEDDQVPATQSREFDGGIALRGQIAVGREAKKAALLGGVVPAGDGGQMLSLRCDVAPLAIGSWPLATLQS
jgi:hypothetical protein